MTPPLSVTWPRWLLLVVCGVLIALMGSILVSASRVDILMHPQHRVDSDAVQDVKIKECERRLDVIEGRLDKHADRLRAVEDK